MNRKLMISNLKSKYGLNAVESERFDGRTGGIWISDDICTEATDYYPYANGTMDDSNVLNMFLSRYEWYAEAYDGETIMLYPI